MTGLSARAQPTVLPPAHPKYRVTQQVCRQLAASFGDVRMPRLTMTATPGNQRIAQFVPKPEPELFIDEKLYDICRSFGPDSLAALAVVLGHELTHYYGNHADWFGFAQLMRQQKPSLVQSEQTQVLEAQADMQGAYRAFLAGFDVYPLVEPLYKAIYAAYKLPVQMTGYPTREQRIESMNRQVGKARTLGMAFDAGLFFLTKRDYATAERCFEFVSDEIPTKELLNNVGLCQLLRAAQAMTLREMPFRYPFEVETTNRLRPDTNRGDAVDKVSLLKRAASYFRQAIDLDETYTTAYINQAAALSLLGRTGTAKETIDQLADALNRINEPLPANARLVRSMALAEQGDTAQASAELKRSTGAYELAYNEEILRNYHRLTTGDPQQGGQALEAIVDRHTKAASESALAKEVRVGAIRLPLPETTTFGERLNIPEPGKVIVRGSRTPDGQLYRIVTPDSTYDVIRSLPGSRGQTALGVKNGDSVQLLVNKYGEPQRVVPAGNGYAYYCYDRANLFVAVWEGTVHNWLIYYVR